MATPVYEVKSVTIADTASLSDAATLIGGQHVVAIITPSSLSGTSMTFQVAGDGATFNNVYDTGGSEVTFTISTSRFIPVPPTQFPGVQSIKVRTGTSGSPSTQTGAKVIQLVVRNYA